MDSIYFFKSLYIEVNKPKSYLDEGWKKDINIWTWNPIINLFRLELYLSNKISDKIFFVSENSKKTE